MTLVENLRRYVGEQVPPEIHSQAWESERRELLETVQVSVQAGGPGPGRMYVPQERRVQTGALRPAPWQHLQEDRDGLHTTAELLQVRVQSLMHILSMQEEELARKVGPSPRASLWAGPC